MGPKHDKPMTGLEDFDPREDGVDETLGMLLEVFAAQQKLHEGTLKSHQVIAEALLDDLDRNGSQFCQGCRSASKVASALRDTIKEQLERAKDAREG